MSNRLFAQVELKPRFSELDPLNVVWHGNYLQYFETARDAFGAKYDISYQTIYDEGFITPIVSVHCDYKASLRFDDKFLVTVDYEDTPAMKIILNYKVTSLDGKTIVALGKTIQVLLSHKQELQLTLPPFVVNWKKKWGLL